MIPITPEIIGPGIEEEYRDARVATYEMRAAVGQATGDVMAYARKPRPTSIYNTVERPILDDGMNSGRVTSIQEYDMNDMHDRLTR